jgi:hypothetical protein
MGEALIVRRGGSSGQSVKTGSAITDYTKGVVVLSCTYVHDWEEQDISNYMAVVVNGKCVYNESNFLDVDCATNWCRFWSDDEDTFVSIYEQSVCQII